MAKQRAVSVVVTGDKQIDRALHRLERKVQGKVVRKALRKAGKFSLSDYKRRVPVSSGAMRDTTKVRAMKRSKRNKGAIGISLWIDKDKLLAIYQKHYGKLPGKRKEDDEPFFYPTVVEFGDSDTPADKPMREAVFGNEAAIQKMFLSEMRLALRIAP